MVVTQDMHDSLMPKRYTYDGRNRLSSVRYASGDVATYRYDPAGNLLECTVSRAGPGTGGNHSGALQPEKSRGKIMVCSRCGAQVPSGNRFCSSCGAPAG